jgi:hypothetical protein
VKRFLLLVPLLALAALSSALAGDHNNVDAGRPLSFDDAESIAYRERAVEFGVGLGFPRRRPVGLEAELEFLYGFRLNSHVSLGVTPSIGGRTESAETSFDAGDVRLGLFHNFNREHGSTPAFALRGDVFLPTGRDSRGVGFRLRGIMSRTARQYDRFHLNLDLAGETSAAPGERDLNWGATLGYTRPLGYPRRFDLTGLADLAVQSGPDRGTGPVVSAGVGLRRQVGVRSVLDLGLRADLATFDGAPRERLRLVAGYSVGY